ncbi:MAG TPA: DNA modification methylase [Methanomassiliicoccales archaeon]|jgi:tRNA (guanine10-N2)-dimethyltransferase
MTEPENSNHSPFLFELSGEHPTLPSAEALACVEAESRTSYRLASGNGYEIIDFETSSVSAVADRIALTHRIGRYLGACDLPELERFLSDLMLPEGSISVRAKRVEKSQLDIEIPWLTRKCGSMLTKGRTVDLENPDVLVRILVSDRLLFYICDFEVDRKQFEIRKVGERPFFSPISLHPRYARTLVNLTRVRRGQTILDPFCGTGGILIEASIIGAKVLGSDIAEDMTRGCVANLNHFHAPFERIDVSDIGDIASVFDEVDVIATDPPYGRSASLWKEGKSSLYSRAMDAFVSTVRSGGRVGVVFPEPLDHPRNELLETECHVQRVHRSLSRHYFIFTRK